MAENPIRKTRGNWLSYKVETDIPWVREDTPITYRGYIIWLFPEEETRPASMAIDWGQKAPAGKNQLTQSEAHRLLMNLCSAMCWMQKKKINFEFGMGASYPLSLGKFKSGKPPENPYYIYFSGADDIPQVDEEKKLLVLALHREALCTDTVSYKFLSYFKILNVLLNGDKKHIEWINNNLDKIKQAVNGPRLEELLKSSANVGEYLYGSGRCAVAHASNGVIVNPDNPEDLARLHGDLPIIKALAEHLIENEMGIISSQTAYRQHLYELEGFKKLFPLEIVSKIAASQLTENDEIPDMPKIDIRIRGKPQREHLTNLAMIPDCAGNGMVQYWCCSDDGLVRIPIALDFKEERLRHDFFTQVFVGQPAGEEEKSITHYRLADILWMQFDLLANGALEIVTNETQERLGRCDAFLPVNVIPNFDVIKQHIENAMAKGKELEQKEAA